MNLEANIESLARIAHNGHGNLVELASYENYRGEPPCLYEAGQTIEFGWNDGRYRDMRLYEYFLRGEKRSRIAELFGISVGRVGQIIRREQRRRERDLWLHLFDYRPLPRPKLRLEPSRDDLIAVERGECQEHRIRYVAI